MLTVFLVFLFPIAVYCAVMANVNRRPHPVLVHGTWDAVGLLFACSGFLLVAGPELLAVFYGRSVRELLIEQAGGPLNWRADLLAQGLVLLGLYYLLVVVGAVLLLWQRLRVTVVYNVTPVVFDSVLYRVLDQLGLNWSRQGNRILIHSSALDHAAAAGNGDPHHGEPGDLGIIRLDPFAPLWNVSLRWEREAPGLRQDLEEELRKALQSVSSEENPTGVWLMTVAGGLFCVIIFGVALMVLFRYLAQW